MMNIIKEAVKQNIFLYNFQVKRNLVYIKIFFLILLEIKKRFIPLIIYFK